MTTTTATRIAKATWKDGSGNTLTLVVRDGQVSLTNQHGISLSLSNVMFATSHNGYRAQEEALRNAVKGCASSAELARVARMTTKIGGWTAVAA